MKKISVLIGLMLVLAVAVSPASALIGGELDTEHTNVGAYVFYWPEYNDTFRACSGTLIHPRVLLTAAHCIVMLENGGIAFNQVRVTFDQNALAEGPTYLDIDKIIAHPDFDYSRPDSHDIALVILAEPVVGIDPEPLPPLGYMDKVIQQTLHGKSQRVLDLIVVGYGASDISLPVPDVHLDAIRRVGTVTFKDLTPFEIKTFQYRNPENAAVYFGDSGGPLFHVDKHGNEVLVGLLACVGGGCSDSGVNYRVDTASARDFIEANLPQD